VSFKIIMTTSGCDKIVFHKTIPNLQDQDQDRSMQDQDDSVQDQDRFFGLRPVLS